MAALSEDQIKNLAKNAGIEQYITEKGQDFDPFSGSYFDTYTDVLNPAFVAFKNNLLAGETVEVATAAAEAPPPTASNWAGQAEPFWDALAKEAGVEKYEAVTGQQYNAESGNYDDVTTYRLNPAFTSFISNLQSRGIDVKVEQVPGYKYDYNLTLTKNGQPIGEPQRTTYGQSYFGDITDAAKSLAPIALAALTFGGGASAIGSAIAPSASAATQAAIGNAVIKGGTTALGGGDLEDVLKSAGIAAATPYIGQNVSPAVSEALGGGAAGAAGASAVGSGITQLLSTGEIDPEKLALSAVTGGIKGYTPDVPSGGTGEEGFFDIGGEGYSPYEEQYGFVADPMPGEDYFDQVIRDIEPGIPYTEAPYDDILAELNVLPQGEFIGENVQSGVPEWDRAATDIGLELEAPPPYNPYEELFQQIGSSPDGNLEQDFVVDQNGNIIDNAGNRGEFVDGEWVVRTDPKDFLNYVGPPAPSPAPPPASIAAPSPTAPAAPAPAPSAPSPIAAPAPAAQKGLDLGALMAMLGGMYGAQEEAAPEYAPARVTNVSPFGLPYGMRG